MSINSDINDSSYYRENLGSNLKYYRLKKHFSIDDIAYMTGVSRSSIIKVEAGKAKDIDSYINYGKAVEYPLETLTDFNIPLKPRNELPEDRLRSLNLTAKVKDHIINTNFLITGKVVAEIREELLRLNVIPEEIKSVDIGGVMRNLKDDGIVTIGEKIGRKIVYFKST